jgi:hypothetical protein
VTRESKKERELRYIGLLQRLSPISPRSQAEPGERPDFTFAEPTGRVGVEVTEYYRPHVPNPNLSYNRPLQEQDALRDRIIGRARDLFAQRFGRPVRVQALFRPADVVDGRQVESLAASIAELVGTLPLSAEHQRFAPSQETPFPSPLTTLYAQTISPDRASTWEVVAAGAMRMLDPGHVLAIIREKEAKLSQYRGDLAEMWLLIVQDYWSRASYGDLSEEARSTVYSTHFHRVLFLRVFQSECVNLEVEHI